MIKLANSAILVTVLWMLAPIGAQSDQFCGTGGAQNGWQCSVAGFAIEEWCQYRDNNHCHWVWVDWYQEKNMFRIECTKPGQTTVVCGHCYNEDAGCCLGSENEPPCVAPPEGPGS